MASSFCTSLDLEVHRDTLHRLSQVATPSSQRLQAAMGSLQLATAQLLHLEVTQQAQLQPSTELPLAASTRQRLLQTTGLLRKGASTGRLGSTGRHLVGSTERRLEEHHQRAEATERPLATGKVLATPLHPWASSRGVSLQLLPTK